MTAYIGHSSVVILTTACSKEPRILSVSVDLGQYLDSPWKFTASREDSGVESRRLRHQLVMAQTPLSKSRPHRRRNGARLLVQLEEAGQGLRAEKRVGQSDRAYLEF
jgi:hypothetical protein